MGRRVGLALQMARPDASGYASPEMLEGRKYLGVETDIWSLGVILYTLLCGGLPFDDDDERVMKELIIKGAFEEPEWLSIGRSGISPWVPMVADNPQRREISFTVCWTTNPPVACPSNRSFSTNGSSFG